jgi:hypothetical protein
MNLYILLSGAICTITSLIHIFAGQVDPVRPLLKSELTDVPKATMLACWHMVSVILVTSGLVLLYAGVAGGDQLLPLVAFISAAYILFSLVFVAVGLYFFGFSALIKLPQWALLLPVGILGGIGALHM